MMLIYLDLCCFNRPFDDQRQTRVRLESEAKLHLQQLAKDGQIVLAWSYIIEYENSFNPVPSRREAIAGWKALAGLSIAPSQSIADQAKSIETSHGLKSFGALHVACAISASARLFVTTDDAILKKLKLFTPIEVVTPINALSILERWYEN